jgi:hypothetical protein
MSSFQPSSVTYSSALATPAPAAAYPPIGSLRPGGKWKHLTEYQESLLPTEDQTPSSLQPPQDAKKDDEIRTNTPDEEPSTEDLSENAPSSEDVKAPQVSQKQLWDKPWDDNQKHEQSNSSYTSDQDSTASRTQTESTSSSISTGKPKRKTRKEKKEAHEQRRDNEKFEQIRRDTQEQFQTLLIKLNQQHEEERAANAQFKKELLAKDTKLREHVETTLNNIATAISARQARDDKAAAEKEKADTAAAFQASIELEREKQAKEKEELLVLSRKTPTEEQRYYTSVLLMTGLPKGLDEALYSTSSIPPLLTTCNVNGECGLPHSYMLRTTKPSNEEVLELTNQYLKLTHQASTPHVAERGSMEIPSTDADGNTVPDSFDVYCFYAIEQIQGSTAEIFQTSLFTGGISSPALEELSQEYYRRNVSQLPYLERAVQLANRQRIEYTFENNSTSSLSRKAIHNRVNRARESMANATTCQTPIVVKFYTAGGNLAEIHVCFDTQLHELMKAFAAQAQLNSRPYERVHHVSLESYQLDELADADPGIPVFAHPDGVNLQLPRTFGSALWKGPLMSSPESSKPETATDDGETPLPSEDEAKTAHDVDSKEETNRLRAVDMHAKAINTATSLAKAAIGDSGVKYAGNEPTRVLQASSFYLLYERLEEVMTDDVIERYLLAGSDAALMLGNVLKTCTSGPCREELMSLKKGQRDRYNSLVQAGVKEVLRFIGQRFITPGITKVIADTWRASPAGIMSVSTLYAALKRFYTISKILGEIFHESHIQEEELPQLLLDKMHPFIRKKVEQKLLHPDTDSTSLIPEKRLDMRSSQALEKIREWGTIYAIAHVSEFKLNKPHGRTYNELQNGLFALMDETDDDGRNYLGIEPDTLPSLTKERQSLPDASDDTVDHLHALPATNQQTRKPYFRPRERPKDQDDSPEETAINNFLPGLLNAISPNPKCWNCEKDDHKLSDCKETFNEERVQKNKREFYQRARQATEKVHALSLAVLQQSESADQDPDFQ